MANEFTVWAESLQKEVYEYWKNNHSDWEPGFQVYYDPVDSSAEILILGYQPGGGESSFRGDRERFEQGDFSLPERYHYLTSDYRLANEMQDILGDEAIRKSVKTNINFFRAPDMDYWETNLPENQRGEIEEFCFQRVEALLDRFEPALVITEGTASTLDPLKSRFGLETDYNIYRNGESGHRLVSVTERGPWRGVGLMHPSGNQIHRDDRGRMKKEVQEIIEEDTSLSFASP